MKSRLPITPQRSSLIWDRISKTSTAVATLFLLLGISAPNWTTRTTVFLLFAAVVIWSIFKIFVKRNREPVGRTFLEDLSTNSSKTLELTNFRIFDALLDSDVTRASQFEATFFPDDAFDSSLLLKMTQRYRPGITMATDSENAVVSLMGLWPISKKVYEDLKSGRIDEVEITYRDISIRGPLRCWWLGVIATEANTRKRNPFLTAHVLKYGLAKWQRDCSAEGQAGIIASGFTVGGSKVASHLGMAKVDGKSHDIYFIEGTRDDIEKRFLQAFPHFSKI